LDASGGAAGADRDGDGVGDARAEQVLGSGAEVIDRVGGLGPCQAVLGAELEDGVGKSRALLWGVDLLGHGSEFVPASVGVVVCDRVAKSLQFGSDLGELDVQGEIDRWQVEEAFPEDLERFV
jgi:hypothetical protein